MIRRDETDDLDDDECYPPGKRDIWFKLRAIGGISTAIVAALIGVLGSVFLHTQQDTSNKIHLYTQLMSEQEKAENAVRKDMFTTILSSFLDKDGSDRNECVMDKLNRQLLELDMISRNFHETMDLRPLFIHLLLSIVRDIPRSYAVSNEELATLADLKGCRQKLLHRLLKKDEFKNATDLKKQKDLIKAFIDEKQKKMKTRLINIARRSTRKQLESLSDVERRLRLTIDLSKTYDNKRPTQPLTEGDICPKGGSFRKKVTLGFNDPMNSHKHSRTFNLYSDRSYPKWNQVHIKVTTNKLPAEREADPDGKEENEAAFWVGYFDFPLVDNTYLSTKERYAVILDEINEKNAKVSLLYFPASYAGFKERSYYQHRIMNTLLKDGFLTK